ncbi:MAG: HAD family hydrolase [Clostridiales bacterium]|nr:HAD family hydrolase [Clostridiales bacterium]
MEEKVVFLDVDGTMVNSKGEIPESAQYAVKTAQAKGHKMVVCSGRSRFQIYDSLLNLGFSGIVGGAGVFVIADGKEIYHAYIDEEHRKSVYDYLEENGFLFCFQADDGVVLNQRSCDGMLKAYEEFGMSKERLERLSGNMHVTEEPWKNEKNEKIIYYGAPFPVEKVHKDLLPYFDAVAISLDGMDEFAGEIGINGINKSTGMEIYLKHVGVSRENCIAIGDGPNDLQMMEFAGISVAMGNAREDVKALADMVTDHIDEDGILHAFERLRLL